MFLCVVMVAFVVSGLVSLVLSQEMIWKRMSLKWHILFWVGDKTLTHTHWTKSWHTTLVRVIHKTEIQIDSLRLFVWFIGLWILKMNLPSFTNCEYFSLLTRCIICVSRIGHSHQHLSVIALQYFSWMFSISEQWTAVYSGILSVLLSVCVIFNNVESVVVRYVSHFVNCAIILNLILLKSWRLYVTLS